MCWHGAPKTWCKGADIFTGHSLCAPRIFTLGLLGTTSRTALWVTQRVRSTKRVPHTTKKSRLVIDLILISNYDLIRFETKEEIMVVLTYYPRGVSNTGKANMYALWGFSILH